MRQSEAIQVLGRGTDVHFTIDDSVPFEIAERSLREYLDICRGLYSSGTVSVNVGRRILLPEQLAVIRQILDEETGLTVTEYWCPREVLNRALAGPETRKALPPSSQNRLGAEEVGPRHDVSESSIRRPEDSGIAALNIDCGTVHTTDPVRQGQTGQEAGDKPGPVAALVVDSGGPQTLNQKSPPESVEDHQHDLPANHEIAADESFSDGQGRDGDGDLSGRAESAAAHREFLAAAFPPGEGDRPIDSVAHESAGGDGHDEANSVPTQSAAQSEPETAELFQLGGSPPSRGDQALIIKNTCRSGEVIRYAGDVVVYGDVNPGAQIIADGDIIVVGALRGMAHAGAGGNLKATIFALNLEAHRLQIGPHIGSKPPVIQGPSKDPRGREAGDEGTLKPKIAYLRRRSIFVSPFVPKSGRRSEQYQGGILYEG